MEKVKSEILVLLNYTYDIEVLKIVYNYLFRAYLRQERLK